MEISGNWYWGIAQRSALALVAWCLFLADPALAYDQQLADQARVTLYPAARYCSTKLATDGTFVWRHSDDIAVRKGGGDAGQAPGWVQPGTPAVGSAFLRIYVASYLRK
jgi:hypothetical protein